MGLDGREGQSSHSLEERLPLQTETLLWFHAGSELSLPIWDQLGSRDVAVVPREGWWHWRLPCAIFVGCDCDGILGISVQHPLSQDSAEWSPSVMFTHPALKSLLTSLTTWKQDTGGFYLVWVLGTVEQVGKERANDSTSVPASLVSRLVLEQFLLPTTAPWMQIMNVNPASLFQGQTPQKKGISQGAGVVNRVCLLCALGWVLPPFFSFFFEAFSACEREQDSSWAHSSSWGEDFCPLFVVMQHCAAFSDEEEAGGGEEQAANMTVIFGWFISFLFWVT